MAEPLSAPRLASSFGTGRGLRHGGLARFLLGRAVSGALILLGISLFVYIGLALLPGDPAEAVLGAEATPEGVAILRERMGLDQPLYVRYLEWLWGALHGDLGRSLTTGTSVSDIVLPALRNTFVLAAIAGSCISVIALVVGTVTGLRPGSRTDRAFSLVTLLFVALPDFIIGLLLIYIVIAAHLGIPTTSMFPWQDNPLGHPTNLVLPALALVLANVGYSARMVRAGVAEAREREYVEMAVLNGLDRRTITWRYIVRNSMAPSVQVGALTLLYLLGGVIVIETLFQYPGIGQIAVQATVVRDFPTVTGLSVVIAAVYVVVNALTDITVVRMTPRLRTNT